jgi:hypothetical protein
VGRRMSHTFAQQFVLGIDDKEHDKVCSRTRTIRKQWESKLKELTSRQLWLPGTTNLDPYAGDFDLKNFTLTYQRCLFCRPSYLYYNWADEKVFRPCCRDRICPFCFARISAAQFRHVKTLLRQLGKQNKAGQLMLTCRVATRFIAAPDFDTVLGCSNDTVAVYATLLERELQRERVAYADCRRALSKTLDGSLYRVVVVPQDTGWEVETRQVFLHPPKTKLPAVRIRNARVAFIESIKVADFYNAPALDTPFFDIFGAFARYPHELLTGYVELVAAYLRATNDMRLASGTGVFKKSGRRLIEHFKRKDANARAASQARKAAKAAAQAFGG